MTDKSPTLFEMVMMVDDYNPGSQIEACGPRTGALWGTNAVQVIVLEMSKIKNMHLSPQAFKKMYNLRLLKFYYDPTWIIGDYLDYTDSLSQYHSKVHFGEGLSDLSDKLRSLIWLGYPSPTLPSNFNPYNLVELDLSRGTVESLWEDSMHAPKLKRLFLNGCTRLTKIPDLSESLLIEMIDIRYCSSLLDFPLLAQHVNNLHGLSMWGCKSLRSFPSDIHFESLSSFDLCGCNNITKFPEISGNITRLDLSWTAMDEVPPSIQCLTKLRELNLSHCTRLQHIPTNIWKLKSLYYLNLEECSGLESFPEILDTMECLEKLKLSGTAIKELPENLGDLKSLIHLSVDRTAISQLPSSMKHLKNLHYLSCWGCVSLRSFPEISGKITHLDLSGTAIDELPPSIQCLTWLWKLNLSYCPRLQRILDNLQHIPSLMYHWKILSCRGCRGLRFTHSLVLPCFLTRLNLSDCNLKEIPEVIYCLSCLIYLDLSENHFEHLPKSMKQLCVLGDLNLNHCNMLQSLTDLPSSLYLLSASDCEQLRSIPDASEFAEIIRNTYHSSNFIFTNCPNLEAAVGNMLALLTTYLNKESENYSLCYSGSEVPGWFIYRTEGSSIKCHQLFSGQLLGFAVCAVIAFEEYCYDEVYDDDDFGDQLNVLYKFISNNEVCNRGDIMVACKNETLIDSDHVALGFLPYSLLWKLQDDFTNCSFEFSLSEESPNCRVKYCGVCPIYANQNIGETSGRKSCTSNDHQKEEV
ncbi:hypothetical protein EZV62_011797 [Acer yangbiense]|uniref:Uncharacterized protein n=1 Tax=Acer yangbiense TaxID=1000413 RepID=A0A5C7I5K4_9ROSI|nr:hypothetical protein EZV62_011797 [Acer yangbiense]